MKSAFNTERLAKSIEALDRTIDAVRDSTAQDFPDAIADALEQVRDCLEEVVNICDDADLLAVNDANMKRLKKDDARRK